jgi:hypothetical protein
MYGVSAEKNNYNDHEKCERKGSPGNNVNAPGQHFPVP